jgi:myo-inositol-1-phosphate synthase
MAPVALSNGYANGNGNGHAAVNGSSNGHANGHSNGNSAALPIVDPTAARRNPEPIKVNAPNVAYNGDFITSKYTYHSASVVAQDGSYNVTPTEKVIEFKTNRKVPKTG